MPLPEAYLVFFLWRPLPPGPETFIGLISLTLTMEQRRLGTPILMPASFSKGRCVCQSAGGFGGGGQHLRTNPGLLVPWELQLPPTHTPVSVQDSMCSRVPGLCQLGPEPWRILSFHQDRWVLSDRNGRVTFLSCHCALSCCFPTLTRQPGL